MGKGQGSHGRRQPSLPDGPVGGGASDQGYPCARRGQPLRPTTAAQPGTCRPRPITARRDQPTGPIHRHDRTGRAGAALPGQRAHVIGEMEWASRGLRSLRVRGADQRNRAAIRPLRGSRPADTIERLQALRVPDENILDRFRFVGPSRTGRPGRVRCPARPGADAVVLDGVNEAMYLDAGWATTPAALPPPRGSWSNPAPRSARLCSLPTTPSKTRTSVAVTRPGNIHKGNGITGSLIALHNAAPSGRGERGALSMFVMKDGPGHPRGHANGRSRPAKPTSGRSSWTPPTAEIDQLDLVVHHATGERRATEEASGPRLPGGMTDAVAVLWPSRRSPRLSRQADKLTDRVRGAVRRYDGERVDLALERLVWLRDA